MASCHLFYQRFTVHVCLLVSVVRAVSNLLAAQQTDSFHMQHNGEPQTRSYLQKGFTQHPVQHPTLQTIHQPTEDSLHGQVAPIPSTAVWHVQPRWIWCLTGKLRLKVLPDERWEPKGEDHPQLSGELPDWTGQLKVDRHPCFGPFAKIGMADSFSSCSSMSCP